MSGTRRRKSSRRNRRKRDSRIYLVGAGVVLAVLIGCISLLRPEVTAEQQEPSESGLQGQATLPVLVTEAAPTAPGADCPAILREMLENNPEVYDFVAGYPGTYDLHVDIGTDYTAGEIPHFLQWDTRWGYYPYGGDRVEDLLGLSGCGPTALSMVVVGLTGNTAWNPAMVAKYAASAGYVTEDSGTSWSLMSEGCQHFGLSAQEVPLWEESMIAAVGEGPIICAMGPGDFTSVGHFIVIVGYENGQFQILDPNSRANSQRGWSYQTLEPQIKGMWLFSEQN